MESSPQEGLGLGNDEQRQQLQQRRGSSSFEKGQVPFFAGWHEGSLSLPTGLRPPQPPSPQPSPKTQLIATSNPFESRGSLRLGEHPQGCLSQPIVAHEDSFIGLPIHFDDNEHHLASPTIELHPASHRPPSVALPTPDTSSPSSGGDFSEASSFAYHLQRERTNKQNFRKFMKVPLHLSIASPRRPQPPRPFVSSPAIVMQSVPPSPGPTAAIAKSMTFAEGTATRRRASPSPHAHDHDRLPSMDFRPSRLRNRRLRGPSGPIMTLGSLSRKAEGDKATTAQQRRPTRHELRHHVLKRQLTNDSTSRRDLPTTQIRSDSSHGRKDTIEKERRSTLKPQSGPGPTVEDVPEQIVTRTATMHRIVPDTLEQTPSPQVKEPPGRDASAERSSAMSGKSDHDAGCCILRCFGCRRKSTPSSKYAEHAPNVGELVPREVSDLQRKDETAKRNYTYWPATNLSFLPTEMTRVNTPPVGSPASSSPRGFFFDYSKPPLTFEEAETRRDSVAGTSSIGVQAPDKTDSNTAASKGGDPMDYFLHKMNQAAGDVDDGAEVAEGIPEHLPNSPICPLHPSNAKRGRLLCPIHGEGSEIAQRRMSKGGKMVAFTGIF